LGGGEGGKGGAAETFGVARHDQMAARCLSGGGGYGVLNVGPGTQERQLQNVAVDRGDSEQFQQGADCLPGIALVKLPRD
jgi:hypothetical protein